MFDAASDTWRQSIQLNNELLEKLESRQQELEKAQRAAQIAFNAAQENLNAISSQMDDIAAQCKVLETKNLTLRKHLSSRLLQRIPLELLRMIFVQVLLCFERGDKWPAISYGSQKELIRAPFRLAAVCSQWRNIALYTPQLWTFVSIPLKNRKLPLRAIHRVETLLARSKDIPLDVLLPWQSDDELAWAPGHDTPESRILRLLGQHCIRWRRFELRVPAGALSLDSMGLFRGATPQLEEFCIVGRCAGDFLAWTATSPNFLPFCPKLRHLHSDYSNIVVSPTNSSLQQLSYLELFVELPFATVWDILRLAAPSLCLLDLQFYGHLGEPAQMLPARLSFPRLERLTILYYTATMFAATAPLVSFPALAVLDASVEALAALLPVWDHNPNEISDIDILYEKSNPLESHDADCLRPYTDVIHLSVNERCVVSGDFVLALSKKGPDGEWIMPALESLTFRKEAELEATDAEALVTLLRARQEAQAQGGPGAPRVIRDVDFQDPDVPDWLVSQVRFVLDSSTS